MSNNVKDGGAAFPRVGHEVTGAETWINGSRGMSLRAYIAAQVVCVTAYSLPHEQAADEAVALADALIARLERP